VTAPEIEPRWIGSASERRFAVCVRPAGAPRGALLFVAPFGEEMNKSRRLVATAARALASCGWTILIPDLFGCGDSPGLLEDATWALWCNDVARAHAWLSESAGARAGLWGLRAGALLAAAAGAAIDALPRLVFWQPVLSGKVHLTQFLRLKVAAEALTGASASVSTSDLLAQLRRGEVLEIAGYRLPPAVALPLAECELRAPSSGTRVDWFEINTEPTLSPPAQRAIDTWRTAGIGVHAEAVAGAPFWQTQELEDCPQLVDATLRALCPADG
jgi:exosortase A-associated hydrolase 2